MATLTPAQNTQPARIWPWLIGAAAFILAALFPPFPSNINYSMIPALLQPLVSLGSPGGIGWQLLHYGQDDAFSGYPLGALFGMIGPFCAVPIILPLVAFFFWRRVVQRAAHPTAWHGVKATALAAAVSLLIIVLLDLLMFGTLTLFQGAALLGLVFFAMVALAQLVWILPGLLLIGALLAIVQARRRAV